LELFAFASHVRWRRQSAPIVTMAAVITFFAMTMTTRWLRFFSTAMMFFCRRSKSEIEILQNRNKQLEAELQRRDAVVSEHKKCAESVKSLARYDEKAALSVLSLSLYFVLSCLSFVCFQILDSPCLENFSAFSLWRLSVVVGVGRGKVPLDFEIWYFAIEFLVEKCFSVGFHVGKMKFRHCCPPWKIAF